MQASHIILGHPWQFDRCVSLDDVTNKYSFMYNNKKITLVPLSPRQVHKDQLKVQKEFERSCDKKKKGEAA